MKCLNEQFQVLQKTHGTSGSQHSTFASILSSLKGLHFFCGHAIRNEYGSSMLLIRETISKWNGLHMIYRAGKKKPT